jgi:hypothetical protein
VLKQEKDWKELPVDMLVLGFHFLQNFWLFWGYERLIGYGWLPFKTSFQGLVFQVMSWFSLKNESHLQK